MGTWGKLAIVLAVAAGSGWVGYDRGHETGLNAAPEHYAFRSEQATRAAQERQERAARIAMAYPWAEACDQIIDLVRDQIHYIDIEAQAGRADVPAPNRFER